MFKRAIGMGVILVALAPGVALAQIPGATAEYSTRKPSGALGTFAWYANGQYSVGNAVLSGNTLLPGIALNLWVNPWLSFGAWGMTGTFGGTLAGVVGPFTSADLEAKLKLAQSGTGAFDAALTGDVGMELRAAGIGVGTSPKVGGIFDLYLPSHFTLQARLDLAPWLVVLGAPTTVMDYKLGLGWQMFHGLGLDVGLRGQAAVAQGSALSLLGPYVGFGYVF